MDFGRRRRSNGNGDSNEFPNLTQFDEVRTTPIAPANNDPSFGNGAYNPNASGQPSFGGTYNPASSAHSFGSAYNQPNSQPSFGSGAYAPTVNTQPSFDGSYSQPNSRQTLGNAYGQPAAQAQFGAPVERGGYVVAPIPQSNERPMVFSDSRVKGQYIYEYSDRLEYYRVSGKSIVHCATQYKIKN